MLYLEDYLELIEHLPQELRDRLTYIRESDLKVNNSSLNLEAKVKHFFAHAKNLTPEQRQCEFDELLKEHEGTIKYADDKVQISDQTHDIMVKLVQRLDAELEKFKLELEADHAGITEELERRSLELDADTRLDDMLHNHLNHHRTLNSSSSFNHIVSFGMKDRRRSEYKHHRHHPYQNNHDNGYHGRGKLSQSQHHHHRHGSKHAQELAARLRQNSKASPYGASLSSLSAPPSVASDLSELEASGHYGNNLSTFGSTCFKNSYKNNNPLFNQQHSALSAALSSTTTPQNSNSVSALAMMNASSVQNKISNNNAGLKVSDSTDTNGSLARQIPYGLAGSQANGLAQQSQQGRKTPGLKAGLAGQHDPIGANQASNRNALAPMAPDQQAFRFNHKLNANGNSSPLYMSFTKSGRATKRPKHHASHLYPDESPTSISSDNSVFENSESLSSSDYLETGPTFGSSSPSSLDFNGSARSGQANTTLYHRDETKYCICRQISYGEMVACDNEECEYEWFHYDCVGVSQPPKGKWYCPDCSRKMNAHHHNIGQAQTQQKKRGRKEKSLFNLVNNSLETVKSKDRSSEQSKSLVA